MPTQNFIVGEMVNKRTLNSKTWINFDGSYTTEIFSDLVHYEDENGLLQNINTDLYDEADFDIIDEPISMASVEGFKRARDEAKQAKNRSIMNRANYNFKALRLPFEATIPRNFKRGYSIGKGANKLTFKPVNASPSISELYENDRSRIVYQDVWNDTDVELKVLSNGIKESIYLKTEKAPTTFSFEVDGLLEDDLTSGEMKLEPAWLQDANGTKRDVAQTIRRENDKTYIDLVADVTELVYPILVDPTVSFDYTSIQDTVIHDEDPTANWITQSNMYIGKYSGNRYWGLFKFDVSLIPYSEITTANLILNNGGSGITMSIHEPSIAWDINAVNWNTFNGNPGALVTSASTYRFDIKSAVQKWVKGTGTNNGLLLKGSNDTGGESFSTIYFTEWQYDETLRPKIEITYNQVPTTPTLAEPNGGENWNSLHTITWSGSTDADGDSITYEIQLTTNNGSMWKTIKTGVTGTSTTYDFINEPETTIAKIRVRAFDGTSYSAWDESNNTFEIQHFHAPTAPTNLTPNGGQPVDRAKIIRFSWQHNDVNTNDPQSKFDLQWRLQGGATWNTVTQVTPNLFCDISGLPHGTIEWRVRTYDQVNLSSPFSDIAVIRAGNKPSAPTITYYEESFANPTIQWSSADQVAFTLKVLLGESEVYSFAGDTEKLHVVQYNLANETSYTVKLTITNADGLESDADSVTLNISYIPPIKPVLRTEKGQTSIRLEVINPPYVVFLTQFQPIVEDGNDPHVAYNDIYRRKQGESNFIRIATNVVGEYIDHAVASDQVYEYYARAVGVNGTFTDSDNQSNSVSFKHVQLHLVSNPDLSVTLMFNGSRKFATSFQSARSQFAGRKRTVTEFGEMVETDLDLSYLVKPNDIHQLEELLFKRETMLYRDSRGRKLYVTAESYSVSDNMQLGYYEVDLPLAETDYTEEV